MNTTDEDLVLYVAIGERELRLVGGSLRTSIHDLPKADVTVNTDQVHSTPVDYLQPVEIRNALGEEAFNGNVQRATPDGSKVELECIGGISLTESIMPAYVAQDCSHIEIVYTAAREAGFSDDRMVIQGLDDLPCEAIEVVAPLIGVSVPAPVKVGDVEFAPATAAQDVLARFNPRPDLADEFERATGVARAYVVGARLLDAEQEGLEQIELALGLADSPRQLWVRHAPERDFAALRSCACACTMPSPSCRSGLRDGSGPPMASSPGHRPGGASAGPFSRGSTRSPGAIVRVGRVRRERRLGGSAGDSPRRADTASPCTLGGV